MEKNRKAFKLSNQSNIDMNPGDFNGSPDEFFSLKNNSNNTLIFIDDGFLSKLSKFFGNGKYLRLHRKDFAEFISKKEGLVCEKVFRAGILQKMKKKERKAMINLLNL